MKKTILIIAVGLFTAFQLVAQSKPVFKDAKVGNAYEQYVLLKDALVASKSEDAKKAAGELKKSLAGITNGKKVADETTKILAATTLIDQRKIFSSLSKEMASFVKDGQLSAGSIYVEYCPMANNNAGASWLSTEKEIKNPYFGASMLKCGSVKETIQ